jgi:hypothetical protein
MDSMGFNHERFSTQGEQKILQSLVLKPCSQEGFIVMNEVPGRMKRTQKKGPTL